MGHKGHPLVGLGHRYLCTTTVGIYTLQNGWGCQLRFPTALRLLYPRLVTRALLPLPDAGEGKHNVGVASPRENTSVKCGPSNWRQVTNASIFYHSNPYAKRGRSECGVTSKAGDLVTSMIFQPPPPTLQFVGAPSAAATPERDSLWPG